MPVHLIRSTRLSGGLARGSPQPTRSWTYPSSELFPPLWRSQLTINLRMFSQVLRRPRQFARGTYFAAIMTRRSYLLSEGMFEVLLTDLDADTVRTLRPSPERILGSRAQPLFDKRRTPAATEIRISAVLQTAHQADGFGEMQFGKSISAAT